MDILLFCMNPLAHGHLSEGIHENPDVDLIRATSAAGLAVNAEPDGAAFQNLLLLSHLDHPDDAVGFNVHVWGSGATRGALETLIAEAQFFSAPFLHFRRKGRTHLFHIGCRFQFFNLR